MEAKYITLKEFVIDLQLKRKKMDMLLVNGLIKKDML